MNLYLVRHGDALFKEDDALRPLSDRGKADVQRVASFFYKAGIRCEQVFHSGKTRARETAEILGQNIALGKPIEEMAGINPNDDLEGLVAKLNDWTVDTMVVGHLPFMGKMVSRLLTGDENRMAVNYTAGSVVCLHRLEPDWVLRWMVAPELLRISE